MKVLGGRRGIKLFLTFLVLFTVFSQTVGWNEITRISLSRSLSEDGSVKINEYRNRSGDRSFYKGDYYCDKAPGASFLYAPFLKVVDHFTETCDTRIKISEGKGLYRLKNTCFSTFLSRFFAVFFISAVPGALLVLLIYKTCRFFVDDDKALITSFVFGLATFIFTYSTVFFGVITATFTGFLAFYLLISKGTDKRYLSVAGFLTGFTAFIEYYTGLYLVSITAVLGISFFYTRYRDKKLYSGFSEIFKGWEEYAVFFSGALIGLVPLMLYNYLVFGGIFSFSTFFIEIECEAGL